MFHKPRWYKTLIRPRRPALRRDRRGGRRGIFTLWTILFAPVLVVLFGVVVEVAHLWLARVELENALEAAALAAVEEWGGLPTGSSTLTPREIGAEYAAANTINGTPVFIGTNHNPANLPNENGPCGENLIFGAVLEVPGVTCPEYEFNAGLQPSCDAGGRAFGVRAQANTVINSLLCQFCGVSFGPFSVGACSTAMYDCAERRPRLIRVEAEEFICPGPDPP